MSKTQGDILRELRLEKDITQEDLGKALNVSKQTVNNWGNNRRKCDSDTLFKLAKFFDVTVDYLFVSMMIHVELPHKNIFITLYNKRLRKITSLALFYTINNIAHNTPIPKYAMRPATSKIILFMHLPPFNRSIGLLLYFYTYFSKTSTYLADAVI